MVVGGVLASARSRAGYYRTSNGTRLDEHAVSGTIHSGFGQVLTGDGAVHLAAEDLAEDEVVAGRPTDAIEELLLSVARGDRQAFDAPKHHMGGLVHVNIRRVLGDASRADALTQEFFTEVLRDAINFDPDLHSAEAWLLTRAHHRAIDRLRSGDTAVGLDGSGIDRYAPVWPL